MSSKESRKGSSFKVDIDVNLHKHMKEVKRQLGDLKSKAPRTLTNAINIASRKVRAQILKDARKRYELKDKAELKTPAIRMSAARVGEHTAKLFTSGEKKEIKEFDLLLTSFEPEAYAARVLKSSSPKVFTKKPKPFAMQFKSGHTAIVARVPGKRMQSNPKREAVEKLLSPSLPSMVGKAALQNGGAEELFWQMLPASIEKAVTNTLKKAGRA